MDRIKLWTLLALAAGTSVMATRPAFAQVALGQVLTEPNGWPIPQPASPPEVSCCVTGRGYPASAAELDGLFKFRNDPNIDWIKDAKTGPGVFSPLCGFSGTLVLRGGNCKLDFGWYNVTQSGPPADADIYTLIPKTDPEVYGAGGGVDFCPLAGVTTNPGEMNKCQVKTFQAANIRMDPNYKGGLIGFALRGDKNSTCSETHYSQNELHPLCMTNNAARPCQGAKPWIMSLIYESKAFPDSYYLAFEDRPGTNSVFGTGMNDSDGDFNDFVFYISGVTCEGGGQPCDASVANPALKGICALGRTGCTAGGTGAPVCLPTAQPTAEKCDNIDNDCNGVVDDGNGLCAADEVCDKGNCVHRCSTGEFACPNILACNNDGFCVDPLCKDVTCMAGQVCRAGMCTGGCTGVTCPTGQECQLGRCVDLCKGVKCEDNQICEKGLCIPSCSCRPCLEGKVCAKDGRCVFTGCENNACAAGTQCMAGGQCADSCQGVVCPGGAACSQGQCGEPLPGVGPGSGGSGGGINVGNTGGIVIGTTGGSTSTSGNGAGAAPGGNRPASDSGCNCVMVPNRSSGLEALGAVALGLALLRRRRAA